MKIKVNVFIQKEEDWYVAKCMKTVSHLRARP